MKLMEEVDMFNVSKTTEDIMDDLSSHMKAYFDIEIKVFKAFTYRHKDDQMGETKSVVLFQLLSGSSATLYHYIRDYIDDKYFLATDGSCVLLIVNNKT